MIRASGALLADLVSGQVLYRKNATTPRPIASITKIMTALLTLESLPLHRRVTIDPRAVFERDDFGASSTLGLRAGERVSVEDLLYALLLGSANDAALALAIAVDGSPAAFVDHMNARARELRMHATHFTSASGLDDGGRSTPLDLLHLIQVANADGTFRMITATRFHRIPAPNGRMRVVQNRNALLWLYPGAFGTKTGTTDGAGPCLVASARRDGRSLVAIVLDAPSEPFSPAAALLSYGFEGWTLDTLVAVGQPEGTVAIRGGDVSVVAGSSLEALRPTDAGDVATTVVTDPTAAFPPRPGQQVGWLVVRSADSTLGRVPLVAAEVPPPPEAAGPWWLRAAGAVLGGLADAVGALAG